MDTSTEQINTRLQAIGIHVRFTEEFDNWMRLKKLRSQFLSNLVRVELDDDTRARQGLNGILGHVSDVITRRHQRGIFLVPRQAELPFD